ncbi:MAG: hypothetical protein JXB32_11340 [Deltaproteobacteria bacterium]|nr:hypothetical protein [Deltaproteobacteria bacterium]
MSPFVVVLLGWSGFKALVKRPFKAPGAERRALRRVAAERLVPLSEDDRRAVRAAGGCLACGRCDELLAERSPGVVPSDWVLGGLRDLTDCDLAAEAPGEDEALARMEAVCPAGVPFRRLAASARAMCDRMRPPEEPRS